jgi:KaiC/GvpD/RAD55 family RecA-like ATPase
LFYDVGGKDYVYRLVNLSEAPINAEERAHMIMDLAAKRDIITIGENLQTAGYTSDGAHSETIIANHLDVLKKHREQYPASSITKCKDWSWASSLALAKREMPPRINWLKPIMFNGAGLLVSGETGAGKTLFGMGMGSALAQGIGFGPYKVAYEGGGVRVLYLDYELGMLVMKERAGIFEHERLDIICRDNPELGDDGLLPLDTGMGKRQVEEFVRALNPDVLIIDNMAYAVKGDFFSGGDKNSAVSEIAPFLKKLGPAYILFHHTGIDTTHSYGDSRIRWGMDGELLLETVEDPYATSVMVTEKKMRNRNPREDGVQPPFTMSFDGERWSYRVAEPKEPKLKDRESWLVNEFDRMAENGFGKYVKDRGRIVVDIDVLREAYKKKHWPNRERDSSASGCCSKAFKAVAAYLSHDQFHVWRND